MPCLNLHLQPKMRNHFLEPMAIFNALWRLWNCYDYRMVSVKNLTFPFGRGSKTLAKRDVTHHVTGDVMRHLS